MGPRSLLLFGVISAVAAGANPQSQEPVADTIHVEIEGLRNDKGRVACALYSSSDGFPKQADKAVARTTVSIAEKKAACEFPGSRRGHTRSRSSTMRMATANWIRTLWEFRARVWERRTAQRDTSGRRNSTRPHFGFPAGVWS